MQIILMVAQIPDRSRDSRVSEQRKGQQEEQGQGQGQPGQAKHPAEGSEEAGEEDAPPPQ